jgi:hypothetical protein
MKIKAAIPVVLLLLAGCVCVSPEQAVNLNEVHEAVVRLMPYAQAGIKARITSLSGVAANSSVSESERCAAAAEISSLTGVLLEAKILTGVTKPIRDWAVKEAGESAYANAKASRDQQAAGR